MTINNIRYGIGKELDYVSIEACFITNTIKISKGLNDKVTINLDQARELKEVLDQLEVKQVKGRAC